MKDKLEVGMYVRTKEEKREYHRNYYKKHKQFEQMEYKVGE